MSSSKRVFTRLSRSRLKSCSNLAVTLIVASFFVLTVFGQQASDSSSLNGTIRDARGAPVVGASVRLKWKEGREYAARTDSAGHFQLQDLPAGVYTLHAEAEGYSQADLPPVVVNAQESKTVDFTLQPSGNVSSANPQFYDEPQFSVAGVTDTTNLGGHGSDVVVRTRDNLARETASLGDAPRKAPSPELVATEKKLRDAVIRDPENFDANQQLGDLLLKNGKPRDALAYLERAQRIKSSDYQNNYELALANAQAGNYEQSRTSAQALLQSREKAELHHLLADVAENLGDPLESVRQYQRAAELEPSEHYLFDWGAELLLHHAPEPALQVFTKGTHLFPQSERMLMGLGAAAYAHGSYDDAVRHICAASDLNPQDPAPYLFLGRMQRAEKKPSDQAVEMLHRFVTLHPDSADANYYYAVALRKSGHASDEKSLGEVQSLLAKAVNLNSSFAAAYLQLGILHADAGKHAAAALEYEKALQIDPQLEEGHYRLAQAYRQLGKPELAQREVRLYDSCVKESAKRIEQERHEIRQFVYTLRDPSAAQTQ
jgi:tetratricopeptide (TPR) repeat protein